MKGLLKNKSRKIIFIISIIIIIIIIIAVVIMVIITTKSTMLIIKKTPLKIGVANTLTGAASTSTIKMRNAIMLAANEINAKGGINGRRIDLVIRDDKLDPEEALRVDRELIDEGVVAIIGHSFSSLALKTVPLMNERNILMISPTVMSAKLAGLDDNLINMSMSLDKEVLVVADICLNRLRLRKMTVVYDLINPGLTVATFNFFKIEFERAGGEVVSSVKFNSREKFSAPDIAGEIVQSGSGGVYIISDAIHSALICQHLRKIDSKIKIIVHSWGFGDPGFISEGGQTVEGVISASLTNTSLTNKPLVEFKRKYKERFGDDISGAAQLSYEAALILFDALSKTVDPKKIKEAILNQKVYEGLDGRIVFDKYGDPSRRFHIQEIRNGKIISIDIIELEDLLVHEN